MTVLVTGAAGFMGSHVVRALLDSGRYDVRILLLDSEWERAKDFAGATPFIGGLDDAALLEQAVDGCQAVLHLAGKNIDNDGTGFDAVNVQGTKRLVEAADRAGVGKVIYLSTVGVYGHRRFVEADETTPLRPDTAFSRSKAQAEAIVLARHQKDGFQAAVVRHRFVYGRGDAHVLTRIIQAAQKYPFLIGGGQARISLIHVESLADILIRLMEADLSAEAHPVYHATDGVPIRYRDMVATICRAYGLPMPTKRVPYGLLYGPVRLKEKLLGIDPEVTRSSISSMRLKLVGLDNCFSNEKIRRRFPDLVLPAFTEVFPTVADYYRQFITQKDSHS